MADALPDPPIPADIDLRTFDDMPLDVRALRDSDTAAEATDEAFRAAVMLWCSAWHQIPAASLPNEDQKLARLAGYGRDLRGWKRVREQALKGFRLCSDGRLYHIYMCVKAMKAWNKKHDQVEKASKRWKGHKPRKSNKTADAAASPAADATAVPQHSPGISTGNATEQRGLYPLHTPPSEQAGSGTPEGSPDRLTTTTAEPATEPEFVEVTMPTGAIIRISRSLQVDEIFAPRDCPDTMLTREQTRELRDNALAALHPTADFEPIPPFLRRTEAA